MKLRIAISFVAVALYAEAARAQTPTALEFGVDATATIGLGDNSFTTISIPSGSVRVGFPMTERVSIEPRGSLSITSGGGNTITTYGVQVGALYHLDEASRMRSGLYVRPAIGVSGYSGSGSQNSVFAGAGIGLKHPFLPQFGSRFEAAFYHNFNNGSSNEIELSAGLSWFTH